MLESITSLLFYFFSGLTLIFALMVISLKNPVHSVLSLIMVFFNAAALLLLIGAEFLSMILIIVYVGAVAVLFLFVVMMFDINVEEMRRGFFKNLPFSLFVGITLLLDLFIIFAKSYEKNIEEKFAQVQKLDSTISNTHQIGMALYTEYMIPFQIAGIILLVAMIGSIILTLRSKGNIKKQYAKEQISRTRIESIEIVKVKIGEGIDVNAR